MALFRHLLSILIAWRRPLTAYCISTVVHGALLVGLGMMVVHASSHTAVPTLEAEFRTTADQPTAWVEAPPQSPATLDVVHSSGTVHSSVIQTAGVVHGPSGGWGFSAGGIGVARGWSAKPSEVGSGSQGFGLAGASESQLRELSTAEHGPSATFFGTMAGGEKFVFVLDISGSMNEGGRFRRAKYELKKTLESLTSSQQFYIIFFNNDAIPLPGPGLVPATAKNTHDAMKWVNGIYPVGDTFPMTALTMALRLDPDAIFLLSDGQFDPEVVYVVSQLNGTSHPIPVHTIALVSRIGEPVMKALSKATGGTFRFVR